MVTSETYKKLIGASKAMHNPIMDKTAKAGNYSYQYASLESVLRVVKKTLNAFEMTIVQGISCDLGAVGQTLVTTVITEDGAIELDRRYMPIEQNAQKFGSFETYMRRYALCSVFGIVGVEDDDGGMTAADKEVHLAVAAKAEDAGRYLGESIAIYADAMKVDADAVRRQIREKLAMTDESKNPDALIREGDNLRNAAKVAKNVV